jgi:HAD superfamily phosphatase (TIGR01668 family)
MRILEPWLKADRLAMIDLDRLKAQNIEALLIDMDNTLVPWHTFDIDERTAAWLDRAKALGFRLCVISNNKKWRILRIMEMTGVKGVWSAGKPFLHGYIKAMKALGSTREKTVFVGDQVFTDLLGANVLGLRTILVDPISPREYKWTRIMRRVERRVAGRAFKGEAEEHGK